MIPELHSLALFMAAALALNLTPGPDMLYVAARSAAQGRAFGIASALGITAGSLVHLTLVALGLAAFLAAVPIANTLLRVGGALYLTYLGARAASTGFACAPRPRADGSTDTIPTGRDYQCAESQVALFFLAFLPQFTDPNGGHFALQVIVLGLLFNTSGTLVNVAVALLVSRAAGRIKRNAWAERVLPRVTGSMLVALGLDLALTKPI